MTGFLDYINRNERIYFVNRINTLICAFKNYPKMENMANEFIKEMINSGHFKDAIKFLQEFWSLPNFKTLFWFKRLITETNDAISQESSKLLWIYIHENISHKPDILINLVDGIKSDEHIQVIGKLEKAILPIFIDLCLESILNCDPKDYGGITRIRFVARKNDIYIPESCLITLIQGLCNPLQRYCYNGKNIQLLNNKTQGTSDQHLYLTGSIEEARDMLLIGRCLSNLNNITNINKLDDQTLIDLFYRIALLLDEVDMDDSNQEALIALIIIEWLAMMQGLPPNESKQSQCLDVVDQIIAELCNKLSKKRLNNLEGFLKKASKTFTEMANTVRRLDLKQASPLSGRSKIMKWFHERLIQQIKCKK